MGKITANAAGRIAELAAADELARRGFKVLERNYRSRFGEIDIIADNGERLVFVEVKCRSGADFGTPAEAVTLKKQRRIIKTALNYVSEKGLADRPSRFDIAEVYGLDGKINIIEGAFDLSGAGLEDFF